MCWQYVPVPAVPWPRAAPCVQNVIPTSRPEWDDISVAVVGKPHNSRVEVDGPETTREEDRRNTEHPHTLPRHAAVQPWDQEEDRRNAEHLHTLPRNAVHQSGR